MPELLQHLRPKKPKAKTIEEELVALAAEFTHDPYSYTLAAYEWGEGELANYDGPDTWQRDILVELGENLKKGKDAGEAIQEAVASGHGIGKSALVAWIILWSMATHEDTKGVVTANTENQLKTKTWAELAKWHRLNIHRDWFDCTATALISTEKDRDKTWRIDMIPWSERNTEAFAGLHNQGKRVLVIFDEASAIPDAIWEVTEGALTDKDTEIIWCAFGNPTRNTGRFRECFERFRHRWHTRQIDSRTAKMTNTKQIMRWIEDYGIDSDFVKVRVRGIFPSMSVKQFISLEDIDAAFGRHLNPEQYNFAPVIMSCDPAWEGDDMLVISKRQGLAFSVLRKIPRNDNDIMIATILAQLEDEHQADAVFVDGGYGTGIISAGRTMHRDWQIVWFGSASGQPGYRNKRAEMWGELKSWLKQGGCLPEDHELRSELLSVEQVPRADGIVQLESKQDSKARGLPSPNIADSLALTFAMPVTKRDHNDTVNRTKSEERLAYDPLSALTRR